eukprot:4703029-Pyramimonas_sp.AAC.1
MAQARKAQTPSLISSPWKAANGRKDAQTMLRTRPLSDDARQWFDGALFEAEHLVRGDGRRKGSAFGATCRRAPRSTRRALSTRAGPGWHEA